MLNICYEKKRRKVTAMSEERGFENKKQKPLVNENRDMIL